MGEENKSTTSTDKKLVSQATCEIILADETPEFYIDVDLSRFDTDRVLGFKIKPKSKTAFYDYVMVTDFSNLSKVIDYPSDKYFDNPGTLYYKVFNIRYDVSISLTVSNGVGREYSTTLNYSMPYIPLCESGTGTDSAFIGQLVNENSYLIESYNIYRLFNLLDTANLYSNVSISTAFYDDFNQISNVSILFNRNDVSNFIDKATVYFVTEYSLEDFGKFEDLIKLDELASHAFGVYIYYITNNYIAKRGLNKFTVKFMFGSKVNGYRIEYYDEQGEVVVINRANKQVEAGISVEETIYYNSIYSSGLKHFKIIGDFVK